MAETNTTLMANMINPQVMGDIDQRKNRSISKNHTIRKS